MRPDAKPSKMKICLICKILVCGLLTVFPVDIKGQPCQCTYWKGTDCESCTVECYLFANAWLNECRPKCFSCLSSTDCNVCKTGCYGPKCDSDCITCRHGLCNNKVCTYGCAVGYYHHAEDGNCRRCPHKCVLCNSITDCTACIAGHTGSICQHCKYGFYRNNGHCLQCSSNCIYRKCDKISGECTDGCHNGWTALRCNDSCASTCASCQRYNKSTCTSCAFGNYDSSCESKCSSNCATHDRVRQCSESNGDCNYGCVDGWTGSQCTEKCDLNCKSCDAQDKEKCFTCSPGFYGQSCDVPCDSDCHVGCDQKTGVCDEQASGNQGNSVVIGGVVGSTASVILIIVAVLINIKRRRNNKSDPETSVTYENSPKDNAHWKIVTPSLGQVPEGEGIYEEIDKNYDIDNDVIKAHCTTITPSLGPATGCKDIFEEMNAHCKIVTPSLGQVPEGEGIYEKLE